MNRLLRSYSKIRLPAKWLKRKYNRSASIGMMKAFVRPSDLVFDVGANYGWKTELFLALGATVVAVEPQQECLYVLRKKFGCNQYVSIEPVALGATESESHIWKSDVRNQLSSMSPDWITAVKMSGRFRNFGWSSKEPVNVTKLDTLIGKYGLPVFCKIDTEGYELEVLKGLSHAINIVSFEYHAEFMDSAIKCLECLDALGKYRFNYLIGEKQAFESENWVNSEEVVKMIRSRNFRTSQGDIYARRSA